MGGQQTPPGDGTHAGNFKWKFWVAITPVAAVTTRPGSPGNEQGKFTWAPPVTKADPQEQFQKG
jgi:hypothetical protein